MKLSRCMRKITLLAKNDIIGRHQILQYQTEFLEADDERMDKGRKI